MPARKPSTPFDLDDPAAYRRWRDGKLAAQPQSLDELRVEIRQPADPHSEEIESVRRICRHTNWVLYRAGNPREMTEETLKLLGERLGLRHVDRNLCAEDSGVTAVTTRARPGKPYIPYTNRPLSWHTDGYYNDTAHQIRGWILHCVQDAADGGDNEILDHELLYIHLRDRDPSLVAALMEPDAMTIPANEDGGRELRPDHSGPVFSVDSTGNLHMRYSARKRNIVWKDRPGTRAAAEAIETLLSDTSAPISRYRLRPGEGIVSNNVLHRRDGFTDNPAAGKKRLFLRARYYDRIAASGHDEN